MSETPRLVPVAPTRGAPLPVQGSPFWIGTAAGSGLQLLLPGIAERHVAVMQREDGFWLSPVPSVRPAPTLNGAPVTRLTRLSHGDELAIAPGAVYRFDTGERPAARPKPRVAPPRPTAPPPAAPPSAAPPPPPRRRRRRPRGIGRKVGIAAVALLVVAALGIVVYALSRDTPSSPPPLTEAEALLADSLLSQSYDRVERGAALLELGLARPALQEFARAVTSLESSPLADNPWVRPEIAKIQATVAEVYRANRRPVPPQYRDAVAPRPSGPLLQGSLSTAEFAARVEELKQAFSRRFGRDIVVTGRDHAEHLSLYGPGGALDLRTRDLAPEQVRFIVDEALARGIRVKDFSTDAVLQAQIRSARQAGLADRAGTGLHLHIDRFANRRDRWTED